MTKNLTAADPTRARPGDNDSRWQMRYAALRLFLETHERHPNTTFASEEERSLRSWCSTQRNSYHGLGTSQLTQNQIDLLEALPGWQW